MQLYTLSFDLGRIWHLVVAAGPVKRCDTVQINRLTGFYISVKIGISDLSVLITFLS